MYGNDLSCSLALQSRMRIIKRHTHHTNNSTHNKYPTAAATSNDPHITRCEALDGPAALSVGATSPGFSCKPADLQSSHVMRFPVSPAIRPVSAEFQSSVTSVAAKSVRTSSNLSSLSGPPTSAPYRVLGLHPVLNSALQSQGKGDGPHEAARWCGRQGGLLPTPTCGSKSGARRWRVLTDCTSQQLTQTSLNQHPTRHYKTNCTPQAHPQHTPSTQRTTKLFPVSPSMIRACLRAKQV